MAFFKIGNTDFSSFVRELNITKAANYNAQTNAAGNTVVEYINHKRKIKVGIISVDDTTTKTILNSVGNLAVTISFLNPYTKEIENNVACILPQTNIEYYTIQTNKVMVKEFELEFIEL